MCVFFFVCMLYVVGGCGRKSRSVGFNFPPQIDVIKMISLQPMAHQRARCNTKINVCNQARSAHVELVFLLGWCAYFERKKNNRSQVRLSGALIYEPRIDRRTPESTKCPPPKMVVPLEICSGNACNVSSARVRARGFCWCAEQTPREWCRFVSRSAPKYGPQKTEMNGTCAHAHYYCAAPFGRILISKNFDEGPLNRADSDGRHLVGCHTRLRSVTLSFAEVGPVNASVLCVIRPSDSVWFVDD